MTTGGNWVVDLGGARFDWDGIGRGSSSVACTAVGTAGLDQPQPKGLKGTQHTPALKETLDD